MRRLWIVLIALFGIYAAVVLRLAQLQLFLHRPLAAKSRSEVTEKKRIRPVRGRILDARGRVLAVSVERASIFVSLRELGTGINAAARRLGAVLSDLQAKDIAAKCRSGATFVWIKRLASLEEGEAASRLGIRGIGVTMESKRFYPQGNWAQSLLGQVGIDGDGMSGLELKLDPLLGGREEVKIILRDALGKVFAERSSTLSPAVFKNSDELGPFDVYLTVDGALQSAVQERLDEMLNRHDAAAGMVIIEDIPTGAIRAMASGIRNPSRYASGLGLDPNLAASFTFEPGSVVKPLVLAWALANGTLDESETIDCEGGIYRVMPGLTIEDHEPKKILKVGEVLAYSSNIGFSKIGLKLGAANLYYGYRSFGLGSKTALPLTGEAVGIVRPIEDWGPMSVPMVSFGYEIGVTPLQLTQAYAALGNQGALLEPQIVARVTPYRSDRDLFEFSPRRVRQVLEPVIAQRTLSLMEEVVTYGTGRRAQVEGYSIAGKTGTAQKIDPKTRRHSPHRVVVSFCGIFPARPRPKLAICAVLDDPRKPAVAWAGDLAAPLFKSVALEAAAVFAIGPAPQDLPVQNLQ